jgi:uncharacterized protein
LTAADQEGRAGVQVSASRDESASGARGLGRDPVVAELYRFPIKGLSPQHETTLVVTVADGLANDRRFALALGSTAFEPTAPEPLDKSFFLMLRRDERLAALRTRFDPDSHRFTIEQAGGIDLEADLATRDGRRAVEEFMLAYLGQACEGRPKLVEAPGHLFTDVSVVSPVMMRALSLINLASVRDLAERTEQAVHPLRFRANIYLDGLAPWTEFDWIGRVVTIGTARFRCVLRTKRCAAIDVDPETGARDTNLCRDIYKTYGHPDCGIYLEVIGDGRFSEGDAVRVAES